MAHVIRVTSYENYHLLVSTFLDISLLVKYLVEDVAFEEQLGRGMKKKTQFPNIFSRGTTNISSGVALKNYLNYAQGNWDNIAAQIAGRDGGGNNNIDNTVVNKGCNTEFNGE